MSRTPLPIETLRLKYNEDLSKAVAEESPLACVMISAALTEKALLTLLSSFYVAEMKSGTVDFSKCADLACCLGLISDGMRQTLKLLGEIRNLFGHSHEFIDFENPHVKNKCMQLKAYKGWIIPMRTGGKVETIETYLKTKSSRLRFINICSTACLTLIDKASRTTHREKGVDTFRDE